MKGVSVRTDRTEISIGGGGEEERIGYNYFE